MALSAAEQYMLELINRARLDPAGEAARLGIDLNLGLSPGTLEASARQPLAPNGKLDAAARAHAEWLMATDTFGHTGADGSQPWDRMEDYGYDWWTAGENLALYRVYPGPIDGDAAMTRHHDGLFESPGHRENMLAEDFREVGVAQHIGAFTADGRDWSTSIVAQNFGSSGASIFLTGVVYADGDRDGAYSIGEGRGGVQIGAAGAAGATTAAAGGYKIALPAGTGWTEVSLASGDMTLRIDMDGVNAKLDVTDLEGRRIAVSSDTQLLTGITAATLLGVEDLTLAGAASGEALTGNRGANVLTGGGGDDIIRGGEGDDTIDGGPGDDTLAGGAGADVFVVGRGADVITNFALPVADGDGGLRAVDRLDFSSVADEGLVPVQLGETTGDASAVIVIGGGDSVVFQGIDLAVLSDQAMLAALGLDAAGSDGSGLPPVPEPTPPVGPDPLPPGDDPPDVVLDGGVATFAGAARAYALTVSDGKLVIVRHGETAGDAIPLDSAEALRFTEGGPLGDDIVDLDAFLGVTDLSEAELSTFVEMYVAYFDRAPDALGLAFWGTSLAGGLELEAIAADFFGQPETVAAFPDPEDSAALVDSAYRNLLEREPDAEGRAFWIDGLDSGAVSRGSFMLSLIDGARANPDSAEDVRTIEAKADIGLAYAALHGLTDADNARTVMRTYDRDDHGDSLVDAAQMIDGFADAARSPEDGTEFLFRFDGLVDDPFAVF